MRISSHFLYLHPRVDELLHLEKFALNTKPATKTHWMRDDCDNVFAYSNCDELTASFEILSDFEAVILDTQPLDVVLKDYALCYPFQYEPLHQFNLVKYLLKPGAETQTGLLRWLEAHFPTRPRETMAFLFELNQTICHSLSPRRRDEPGIQTSLQTLALNSGACRDYAVLLAEILRTLGIAARFVSGYFYDPTLAQAASMHAWTEAYVPGAGWKGLDPSTGLFCYDAYVPVAHAAVAESVNPIQGAYLSTPANHSHLTTTVSLEKLAENSPPSNQLPEMQTS